MENSRWGDLTGVPSIDEQDPRITPVSVICLAALAVMTFVALLWIISGPVFDGRHLVGLMLGIIALVTLVIQTFGRLSRLMLQRAAAHGDEVSADAARTVEVPRPAPAYETGRHQVYTGQDDARMPIPYEPIEYSGQSHYDPFHRDFFRN
jgi:hypothetical protein